MLEASSRRQAYSKLDLETSKQSYTLLDPCSLTVGDPMPSTRLSDWVLCSSFTVAFSSTFVVEQKAQNAFGLHQSDFYYVSTCSIWGGVCEEEEDRLSRVTRPPGDGSPFTCCSVEVHRSGV